MLYQLLISSQSNCHHQKHEYVAQDHVILGRGYFTRQEQLRRVENK